MTRSVVGVAREMRDAVDRLSFAAPVTHVYNPLRYAWEQHRRYLERFVSGRPEVLLIGMNPGPWGMAQTGVPFGDAGMVRDWIGIRGRIGAPDRPHPKRPVHGLACPRGEVSGRRLWGWARDRFGTADAFRRRFAVINYCPLSFLEKSGRNRTPDRLARGERGKLFAICDDALRRTVRVLKPRYVVGIGRFAEGRALEALRGTDLVLGRVPHPSPASPSANRDWAGQMDRALKALGITLH